jgi:hypothetical protein
MPPQQAYGLLDVIDDFLRVCAHRWIVRSLEIA